MQEDGQEDQLGKTSDDLIRAAREYFRARGVVNDDMLSDSLAIVGRYTDFDGSEYYRASAVQGTFGEIAGLGGYLQTWATQKMLTA